MLKWNKKLLAATFAAASATVVLPVVLSSCSQSDINQNNGTGADNNVKYEAIISDQGNDYNETIIVIGNSGVESLRKHLSSNQTLVNDIVQISLSDSNSFKHINFNFKDVVENENGNYQAIFSTSLQKGYSFADKSKSTNDVVVNLTNVFFKNTNDVSSINYSNLIDVSSINRTESVDALESYLTENNNQELNNIINSITSTFDSNTSYIKSIDYKESSVKKVNGLYKITLTLTAKANHLFANGNSSKEVEVNLTNVKFSLTGAVAINSSYDASTYFWFTDKKPSIENAKTFLSDKSVIKKITNQLIRENSLVNATLSISSYNLLWTGDVEVTFDATAIDGMVFKDKVNTKKITVTINKINWLQTKEASAKDASFDLSKITSDTRIFKNNYPSVSIALSYLKDATISERINNLLINNSIIKNVYLSLNESSIKVTENSIVATYNAFTKASYVFADNTVSKNITITINNVNWRKKVIANNTRFDASDITWFNSKQKNLYTLSDWYTNKYGWNDMTVALLKSGQLKNATLTNKITITDLYNDYQHIQTYVVAKANDGCTFDDGSTEKRIQVIIDNIKWAN